MIRRTPGQVPVLLKLRWQMLEGTRQRATAGLLLLLLPGMLILVIGSAAAMPRLYADEAAILAPSAYLAFFVASVIAPISAGGGNELYPPSQLLAYPIRAATTFHGSLTLVPLNIAWLTNVLALVGLTVYIVPRSLSYVALAIVTGVVYAASATLVGALLAWYAVGLRQSPIGRRVVTATGLAFAFAAAAVIVTGRITDLLDEAPTRRIIFGLLIAVRGDTNPWARRMLVVVLAGVLAYALGRWVCAWALRRPATTRNAGDGAQRHQTRPTSSPLRQMLALDRASIWRSTSLRRGLLVLGSAPGALAAAISLQWSEILLLPGLAAAGAGLLFGVNAFCLHGTGLVWLASQPQALRLALLSKGIVTAEVCMVAVMTTVVAASIRAQGQPSLRELTTLLVWCPLVVAVVVAICLHLSVSSPHRADLAGHRDVPAPPGAMALYSVRLAVITTTLSLLVTALIATASERLLWSSALLLAGLCAMSMGATASKWRNRSVRAVVVSTVAAG